MKKLVSVSIAATVAAAALACSDDPPAAIVEGNDPAMPPVRSPGVAATPDADAAAPDARRPVDPDVVSAIAGIDKALADAVCARLEACCAQGDYEKYFLQFQGKPFDLKAAPPRNECASTLAGQLGRLHAKWASSVSAGRMKLDPARAQKCVADVSAAACGLALTKAIYSAECFGVRGNEVFTKTTPLGAACDDIGDGTFYGECNPAFGYCGSNKTCEAWKKTGEPCSVSPTRSFCSPELACDGLTPSKPGKCSGPPIVRQLGEPCVSISGPLVDCAPGLYCDYASEKCVAKKADGATCQSDDECATAHPYTCSPFGGGTCGSTSFCGGRQDGGQ